MEVWFRDDTEFECLERANGLVFGWDQAIPGIVSFTKILTNMELDRDILKTSYHFANGRSSERLYNHPRAQNTPAWISRVCQADNYHDIDIVNYFPTILYNLAKRSNTRCKTLHAYVTERTETIQRALRRCNASDLTPKNMKKCFLIAMHNEVTKQLPTSTQ